MNAANGNELLSETAVLVENILDDLLAEVVLDGPNGPIDPSDALIEMAARAIARAVLDHGVPPSDAAALAQGRSMAIMMGAVELSSARVAPSLRLIKLED